MTHSAAQTEHIWVLYLVHGMLLSNFRSKHCCLMLSSLGGGERTLTLCGCHPDPGRGLMMKSVFESPPRLGNRRFPGPWQCFLSKAWLAGNILSQAKAMPLPSPRSALAGNREFFNIPWAPAGRPGRP